MTIIQNDRIAVLIEMDPQTFDAHIEDNGDPRDYVGLCRFVSFMKEDDRFDKAKSWSEINAIAKSISKYHRVWFFNMPDVQLVPGMTVRRRGESLFIEPYGQKGEVMFDRGSGVAYVIRNGESIPFATGPDGDIAVGEDSVYNYAERHNMVVRIIPRPRTGRRS